VVAGQHAQAAAVDGQAFGDAELRAEVRHVRLAVGVEGLLPPARLGQVVLKLFVNPLEVGQEALVGGHLAQPLLVDLAQHGTGLW